MLKWESIADGTPGNTVKGLLIGAALGWKLYICTKKNFLDLKLVKSGELRSFGAIREKAEQYNLANDAHKKQQEARGNKVTKLSSAEWDSCEKMPLLDLDDSTLLSSRRYVGQGCKCA